MYSCKTCVPPIEVKADGQDQKVTGYPYFDTISVKIVDEEVARHAARVTATPLGHSTAALHMVCVLPLFWNLMRVPVE
jgi:hypothetical protein